MAANRRDGCRRMVPMAVVTLSIVVIVVVFVIVIVLALAARVTIGVAADGTGSVNFEHILFGRALHRDCPRWCRSD